MRNIADQLEDESCDMKTKTKFIAGAIALLILLMVVNRFVRLPFMGVHSEDAIPRHTALVLLFNKTTLHQLKDKSDINNFARLFLPAILQADLQNFEKIFRQNFPIEGEKEIWAAVQPTRSNGFDLLFILDGARNKNLETILRQAAGWRVRKSVFRNQAVFTLQTGDDRLAIAKFRNLLLVSRHAYLVENALSQLKNPGTSLCRDKGFIKTTKTAKAEAERLHVLLNLAQTSAEFAPILEPGRLKTMSQLDKIGSWLHLQLPAGKKVLEWKGKLATNTEHPLLSANSKGPSLPFRNVFRAIPDNLGLFFWLSLGNVRATQSSGDWNKYFDQWVGNEVAFAIGEPIENDLPEQFLLLKTNNQKKAESALEGYAMKAGKLESFDFQMFQVQQFMGNGLGEMLGLGSSMSNPYACILGEYVLFSNSKAGMERWLGKYIAGLTCSKNVPFLQSLQALPVEAQGFLYVESVRAWQEAAQFFNSDFLGKIGGNPLKFNHLAATMKRAGNICEFTVAAPKTSKSQQEIPASILWKTPLLASVTIPPVVFQNPQNGEMEVFVQDSENRIYLISKSGRILMRRNLDGPIMSQVFQLDLFNNKEGQFAFNTSSGIYVVDRTGADLAGFPLRLQTPASNGLTVIDFFKSKDYQFFIACENGNAYGFDENGSPVEGWRPKTDIGLVRLPLVHFQAQGMDFMILMDETGRMQVFQKNGAERFADRKFESVFPQAPDYQASGDAYRIVACNENGKVFVTNLKGEDFGLNLAVGKNKGVKFAFADVLGDERKDYLALSENHLSAYFYEGSTFKKGFDYQFDQPQDEVFPASWKGRKKAFIGTVTKQKKQIFLIDAFGRLLPQFPLAGTTSFKIADLLGDGNPVIVAGYEENVIAYTLE